MVVVRPGRVRSRRAPAAPRGAARRRTGGPATRRAGRAARASRGRPRAARRRRRRAPGQRPGAGQPRHQERRQDADDGHHDEQPARVRTHAGRGVRPGPEGLDGADGAGSTRRLERGHERDHDAGPDAATRICGVISGPSSVTPPGRAQPCGRDLRQHTPAAAPERRPEHAEQRAWVTTTRTICARVAPAARSSPSSRTRSLDGHRQRVEDHERRREQADRGEQRHGRPHVRRRRAERLGDVLGRRQHVGLDGQRPLEGDLHGGRVRPGREHDVDARQAPETGGRRGPILGRRQPGGGRERHHDRPARGSRHRPVAGEDPDDRDRDRGAGTEEGQLAADVQALARGEPLGHQRLTRTQGRGARAADDGEVADARFRGRSMPRTVTGAAPTRPAVRPGEERPPLGRRARRPRRPAPRRRPRAFVRRGRPP